MRHNTMYLEILAKRDEDNNAKYILSNRRTGDIITEDTDPERFLLFLTGYVEAVDKVVSVELTSAYIDKGGL